MEPGMTRTGFHSFLAHRGLSKGSRMVRNLMRNLYFSDLFRKDEGVVQLKDDLYARTSFF